MSSIKGRITGELYSLFKQMESFGQSKRDLKVKAIAEGKTFYHYYKGKVFALSTLLTYKRHAKNFAHWCVDRFGIEHINQIRHGMVRDYFADKLSQLKPNTIKTHLAAIAKLGEGTGRAESFHRVSRQIQSQLPAQPISRPVYRADQAQQVLAKLEQQNPIYGLAMRVQLETSCRLVELERLRVEDLAGIIQHEGKTVGMLELHGKGGRPRAVVVTEQTYWQLEKVLTEQRKLITYDGYRSAVYRVSKLLGLHTGGTHKARRSSVQKLASGIYRSLRATGLSSQEARRNALQEANRQLGHSPARPSTTRLYLRTK